MIFLRIPVASLAFSLCIPFSCVYSQEATTTPINGPHQLVADTNGNLYVSEEYGQRILRIGAADHRVTVIAGNGKQCCRKEDVSAKQSSVYHTYSLAIDSAKNVYISGRNARDGAFVRVINGGTGKITTLARGNFPGAAVGVPAIHANLSDPKGMVVLSDGTFADESNVIVALGNTTVAFAGDPNRKAFSGDGGPALKAGFNLPGSLAVDRSGNVFVADYYNHRVRRIDALTHVVTTIAGNGSKTSSGDDGKAIAAGVSFPIAIAVAPSGDVYLIENGQFKVRKVDSHTGTISTIAGTGRDGFSGDGGDASKAEMNPAGIAVDRSGNVYIADMEHNRICRVDASGTITTVAGNGLPHRNEVIE
jgi:DNA-binding beta-propeller fold protein YncE